MASELSKEEQLKIIAEMHSTNATASVDLIRRFSSDFVHYLKRIGGVYYEALAYEILNGSRKSIEFFDLLQTAEWPQNRRSQYVDAAFQKYVFWYELSETAKSTDFHRLFYDPETDKEIAERLWQLRKSLKSDDPAAQRALSYDTTSDFLWILANHSNIGAGPLLNEVLETIEREFGSERLASALSKANIFQIFKADHKVLERFSAVHGRVNVNSDTLTRYLYDTRLSGAESVRLVYGLVQATGADFSECCAESIKLWLKSEYSYYGYTKNHASVVSYLLLSNRRDLITLGSEIAATIAGDSPGVVKETWVKDLLSQTEAVVGRKRIEKILPSVWSAEMINWAEEFVRSESGKADIVELFRTNLRHQPYKIAQELLMNFYEADGKVKSDRQFTDKMDRWSANLYSWVTITTNSWRGIPPLEEVEVLERAIALNKWPPELQAAVKKIVSDYPSLKSNKGLIAAKDSRASSRSADVKSVDLNELRKGKPVPPMNPAGARCAELLIGDI